MVVQVINAGAMPKLNRLSVPVRPSNRVEKELSPSLSLPPDQYRFGQWKPNYSTQDLAIYKASLNNTQPLQSYDPHGFFTELGITDVKSSGRGDASLFQVYRLTDYKPDPEYFPGPKWIAAPLQKALLWVSRHSPKTIVALDKVATQKVIQKMEQSDTRDPHPFGQESDIQKGERSTLVPSQRYYNALAQKNPTQFTWEEPVHTGSIKGSSERQENFGTYDIARQLGFTEAQAKTIAVEDFAVDTNQTHYHQNGKTRITKSGTGGDNGDFHWHFNRSPAGQEDTRITAARTHLERAVSLAKQGYYDAAERELGIGLHSLQDMFAHGQLTPVAHTLLGEFPDYVWWNPQGMFETALATEAYLKQYFDKLGVAVPQTAVKPTLKTPSLLSRYPLPPLKNMDKHNWQMSASLITGNAPLNQQLDLAARLQKYPTELLALLNRHQVQIFLGQQGTPLTQLGFGQDLDQDGLVSPNRWVDRNQDGIQQATEVEDQVADGRRWNEQQAAYQANHNLIYLSSDLNRNPADLEHKLQHEMLHALDFALQKEPGLQAKWSAYINQNFQQARGRGEITFDQTNAHEYFAHGGSVSLSRVSQALAQAVVAPKAIF